MGLFLFLIKVCYLLNPELAFSKEAKGLDLGISKTQSYEWALHAHCCLPWHFVGAAWSSKVAGGSLPQLNCLFSFSVSVPRHPPHSPCFFLEVSTDSVPGCPSEPPLPVRRCLSCRVPSLWPAPLHLGPRSLCLHHFNQT